MSKIYINGIEFHTNELLFSDVEFVEEENRNSKENNKAINTIRAFTLNKINKIINKFRYNVNFDNISFNEKEGIYTYDDGKNKYDFRMMSSYIKDKEIKKELKSPRRGGKCRISSVTVSNILKSENKIVTGYYYVDNGKYLHTVVETELGGEQYVLDFTSNIMMKKDQYQSLFKFEQLEAIKDEDYRKDERTMENLDAVTLKKYLLFGKEIIKDLEGRNPQLFPANTEKDNEKKSEIEKE